MDDYKQLIIDLVRNKPLLWDPRHPDYKSKDQKKQVWEELDKTIQPPEGCSCNSKSIWDQLMRGFCNVLKKKNKKSGSGADTEKEWKFEKDLQFLLPVKRTRPTSGNLALEDSVCDSPLDEVTGEGVAEVQHDQELTGEVMGDASASQLQVETTEGRIETRKGKKRQSTNDDEILSLIRQRQLEKSKETPRFLFMKSLMPMVEELTTDDYMDFQVNIIQDLRRKRAGQANLYMPGTSNYQRVVPSSHTHSPLDAYYTPFNTRPSD